MTLNNCTTCGQKPEIKLFRRFHYAECKCSKIVGPDLFAERIPWSAEVAADMWNRANPEIEMSIQTEHINRIAAQLSKLRAHIFLFDGKLCIKYPIALGELRSETFCIQMDVRRYEQELTDFYKNRLQP